MEGFVKQYDKANMKKAILKQEEIFRKQVQELHRLYRIQKLLMNDMKKNTENHLQGCNAEKETSPEEKREHRRSIDLELPAEEYIGNNDVDIGEESEIELTLATGTSFSSSSTESRQALKLIGHQWGQFRDVASDGASDIDERERKERLNQLPWSFPCLSLKMT